MGGRMFPVVCAAPLSKEIMDRFIEENNIDEDKWYLVFVDTIDDFYDEISELPIETDSNPNSPFIGKSPEECYELLLKLCEDTESEIMTNIFAIMDERSMQDDTVLLVNVSRNPGGENEVLALQTIRATFQASALAMMLYLTGHSSVAEDAEHAQREHDNVYRGNR